MRALFERFVCVRLVRMNGVDLRQFRFDFDTTLAAFALHHDGTVFARYGSRSAAGPMVYNSTEGLVATLERVLAVYPEFAHRRELFAAKRGPEPTPGAPGATFVRPEEFPSLRVRDGGRRVGRGNCIHCHEVHEAMHAVEMAQPAANGSRRPAKIFKYPPPETIGLEIDPRHGQRVVRVVDDSPAAAAGLRVGDELRVANGQAVLSIADLQFVLHHLDDAARLEVVIARDGRDESKTLGLASGWKRSDFTWRVSMAGFPADSGLYVHRLGAERRRELGVAENHVALEVRGLFRAELERSGLRTGDVIVGYDGCKAVLGALEFESWLRIWHHEPGSVLVLDVRRAGESKRIEVRF